MVCFRRKAVGFIIPLNFPASEGSLAEPNGSNLSSYCPPAFRFLDRFAIVYRNHGVLKAHWIIQPFRRREVNDAYTEKILERPAMVRDLQITWEDTKPFLWRSCSFSDVSDL